MPCLLVREDEPVGDAKDVFEHVQLKQVKVLVDARLHQQHDPVHALLDLRLAHARGLLLANKVGLQGLCRLVHVRVGRVDDIVHERQRRVPVSSARFQGDTNHYDVPKVFGGRLKGLWHRSRHGRYACRFRAGRGTGRRAHGLCVIFFLAGSGQITLENHVGRDQPRRCRPRAQHEGVRERV